MERNFRFKLPRKFNYEQLEGLIAERYAFKLDKPATNRIVIYDTLIGDYSNDCLVCMGRATNLSSVHLRTVKTD